MKKFLILIILILSSIVSAASPTRTESVDVQYDWVIGTHAISASNPILVKTAMDDVNVQSLPDANRTLITLNAIDYVGGVEWRFRILDGNDNDISQIEQYVRSNSNDGNDHWIHSMTLKISQGLQEYSGLYYFVDKITDSNCEWYHAITPLEPNDSIGRVPQATFGVRQFLFIAPDLNDSDKIYIDYRRWSR